MMLFSPNLLQKFAMAAAAVGASLVLPAEAQTTVGTITVCYYAPACDYTAKIGLTSPVDSPAFKITNTSSSPITHAVFTILRNMKLEVTKDRFTIGRIAAGKSVIIVPG